MAHKGFPLHILAEASHARLEVRGAEPPFWLQAAEALDHVLALAASQATDRVVTVGPPRLAPVPRRARGGRMVVSAESPRDLTRTGA